MSAKFYVLFLTAFLYGCIYHNNYRSGDKIKVSHKYIKFVFPLLDRQSEYKVDIILFLEAVYLIISCIIYYTVIFLNLISFEIATMIWISMLVGTTLVMAGGEVIRESREGSTIVITILELIFGILFILVGLLITILTLIGRKDILINYLVK